MGKLDDLIKKAKEDGAKARADKKNRVPPMGEYPTKRVREAWLEGWDQWDVCLRQGTSVEDAVTQAILEKKQITPEMRLPQVVVRVPEPEVRTRGTFLSEKEPMPTHLIPPQTPTCTKCRCVRLASGAQAVLLRAYNRDRTKAYLECRACGHQFDLPVLVTKSS